MCQKKVANVALQASWAEFISVSTTFSSQGGMNEAGLFFDGFATAKKPNQEVERKTAIRRQYDRLCDGKLPNSGRSHRRVRET